jgi:protein TonB
MFEQSIVVGRARTRRAWTVPVSFAGQVGVVGLMVLMPFVFIERLPQGRLMPLPLTAPPAYVAEPVQHAVMQLVATPVEPGARRPFTAPGKMPDRVAMVVDPVGPPADPVATPCVGCVPGGVPGAVPTVTPRWSPPDPPVVVRHDPPVKPPVEQSPVRVPILSIMQEAKLITRVIPVYPRLALLTRTTGVVHLAAVIGADGRIRELRVLSGPPLLVGSAVDAVRQWVYRPTVLNGDPVEVSTDITVTFRLTN